MKLLWKNIYMDLYVCFVLIKIMKVSKKEAIEQLVFWAVDAFAEWFQARHERDFDNPNWTINMKIHNVFVAALGDEIQFHSSLVRSLDSSLWNMLEKLAINIAWFSYAVHTKVEWPLSVQQTQWIAELLEKYKRRQIRPPTLEDYQFLRVKEQDTSLENKRHESDYCLVDKETWVYSLIELKIWWDLDNKKARSEKEALLEQFTILSNTLWSEAKINLYFATAYNRYWEWNEWKQERVRQFFADDELLIWREFWNFICKSNLKSLVDRYNSYSLRMID